MTDQTANIESDPVAARATADHLDGSHISNERSAANSDAPGDPHSWRTTLIVWAVLTVFCAGWMFVFGIYVVAFLRGKAAMQGLWLAPGDLWPPVFAGKVILYGGSLKPYTLNPSFVAMPLYAAVMLPVSAIVEIFGIPRPDIPRALMVAILDSTRTATMTNSSTTGTESIAGVMFMPKSPFAPVAFAYVMVWAIPFLKVVRSLAFELGTRRRLWTLQVAAFFLCWFPAVLSYGHLEDGITATLVMYAVLLSARRQWMQVAIAMALALSLKQTAVLAVPLFLFFVPKGQRLRFALVTASIPAVLLAAVFLSDFASASKSLLNPPTWPGVGGGRTALFITSTESVLRPGPFRYASFVLSLAVALWLRRNRSVPLLLAGLAVVAATRLPFESVLHAYYAAPFLVLAAVYEKRRRGNVVFAAVFGSASLLIFWIGGIPDWAFWPAWAVLTVLATWPTWIDVARRRFGGPPEFDLIIAEAGFGSVDEHAFDDSDETQTDRTDAPSDGVIL